MREPARTRQRRRARLPDAPTAYLPGGGVGLDLGPALHALAVRQLLQDAGLT